jgi:TonB family protein
MHEIWMHERMTMASGWLVNYLAHSALALAVIGAMAWVGDRLLRRVGPRAQHRMWVAALLTGVALPLVPTDALIRSFIHADGSAAGGTATVTYHMIAATAGRWSLAPLLSQMLAGAYLLTVLFCVSRLLWRWLRTRAMARRSAVLTFDSSAHALLEGAAGRFGVPAPELRCSAESRGPVVLGVRRVLLLVPKNFFAAQNSGDTAAALAHECAHIARRDFGKNLLYECVAAAVAYHPTCWLMRRRIAETRELVCDEMAARAVGDRPEYAASLLRLATAMAAPAPRIGFAGTQAIGVFDANILEERIMRLTMDLPAISRTRKVAMATVAGFVLLAGAAIAAALPFDVTPQADATTADATKEKIYHVGNGVTPPALTYSVDAKFSKKAKDAKYQGVSVVSCIVDTHGMPQHVRTVRKLGMGLDEKALEAVRQYRFKPGTLNGKPVAVVITIEVNFHIY